jgi:hypothetical protein
MPELAGEEANNKGEEDGKGHKESKTTVSLPPALQGRQLAR